MEITPSGPIDEATPPLDLDTEYRRAAVLLLLYPRAGEDYLVFTRRTDTVEHHKGQISLPGGAQDPGDHDIAQTALREAQEEIGVDPEAVEVLGTLRDIYARVSSFVITPVVARLKPEAARQRLVFHPNPHEVAEIIEVPLSALRDETIHRTELRTHQGVTYNVHYYNYGPYEIWGATGRIIHEFLNTGGEEGEA
jgi:8-oxo-dGTP pyrophosphatase MutT (NUDIX family)